MRPSSFIEVKGEALKKLSNIFVKFGNTIENISDDIIKKGLNAGSLAKLVGNEMGGGGGGKPSLATAGGKDLKSYTIAMKKSIDLIKSELNKVEGD